MADRNRRYDANRSQSDYGSRDQGSDYYGSRQAEQFDDGSSYDQDQWSSDNRGNAQMNDSRRRPSGFYYEEVTWQAPARDGYASRDRNLGRSRNNTSPSYDSRYLDERYDNGLGYYDTQSRGRTDLSRDTARSYDRQRFQRADYDRGRSASDYDRDRGFFDRAGDEIASWFGDEDAARRRQQDHRGSGPSGYTRSDERILEDVCDRLTQDWEVDARNVQVTVNGGEVTLDGTVDNRGAKRRAEDIVDDVSGVGHVQNNLRVSERDRTIASRDTISES